MMRGKLIKMATILAMAGGISWDGDLAAQAPPTVSFK